MHVLKYHIFLKPIKDDLTLWNVNISEQLKEYFEDLSRFEIFCDSASELNFFEAGLIINGCAQMYGKKIELLLKFAQNVLSTICKKSNNVINEEDLDKRNNSTKKTIKSSRFNDQINEDYFSVEDNTDFTENIFENENSFQTSHNLSLSTIFLNLKNSESDDLCLLRTSKSTIHTISGAIIIDAPHSYHLDSRLQPVHRSSFEKGVLKGDRINKGIQSLICKKDSLIIQKIIDSSYNDKGEKLDKASINSLEEWTINDVQAFPSSCPKDSWKLCDPYEPGGLLSRPLKKCKTVIRGFKMNLSPTAGEPLDWIISRIADSISKTNEANSEIAKSKVDDKKEQIYYRNSTNSSKIKSNLKHVDFQIRQSPIKKRKNLYLKKPSFYECTEFEAKVQKTEKQQIIDENSPVDDCETNLSLKYVKSSDCSSLSYANKMCSIYEETVKEISQNAKIKSLSLQNQRYQKVEHWKTYIKQKLKMQKRRSLFNINNQCENLMSKLITLKSYYSTLYEKEDKMIRHKIPLFSLFDDSSDWKLAREFVALLQLVNDGNLSLIPYKLESQKDGQDQTFKSKLGKRLDFINSENHHDGRRNFFVLFDKN